MMVMVEEEEKGESGGLDSVDVGGTAKIGKCESDWAKERNVAMAEAHAGWKLRRSLTHARREKRKKKKGGQSEGSERDRERRTPAERNTPREKMTMTPRLKINFWINKPLAGGSRREPSKQEEITCSQVSLDQPTLQRYSK